MAKQQHVALVTGAGRNIGRTIVMELAGRGYNVIVNGLSNREAVESVAEEARAAGVEATPILADVGDPDAVRTLAEAALEAFGKVDVVVNNAAIRPQAAFLEMQ